MSHVLRRVLVLITSLLLAAGVAAAVPSTPASAATGCSAQDQRYGATQARLGLATTRQKRTAKKVRKAKRLYAKRHTTAQRKRLTKARTAHRKATRSVRVWRTRHAAARQAAARCSATAAPQPQPQPQPQAPQVQQLLGALGGLGLDTSQVQSIADQIAGTLAAGELSPAALVALLQPVVDGLGDAGLPADQVAAALQQVLGSLAAGDLPTDPGGLVDLLVDSLQAALAGTPLDQLNPLLEQVQTGLSAVLAALLGGLPLPGLPGL